jgi:hypothetical protein
MKCLFCCLKNCSETSLMNVSKMILVKVIPTYTFLKSKQVPLHYVGPWLQNLSLPCVNKLTLRRWKLHVRSWKRSLWKQKHEVDVEAKGSQRPVPLCWNYRWSLMVLCLWRSFSDNSKLWLIKMVTSIGRHAEVSWQLPTQCLIWSEDIIGTLMGRCSNHQLAGVYWWQLKTGTRVNSSSLQEFAVAVQNLSQQAPDNFIQMETAYEIFKRN